MENRDCETNDCRKEKRGCKGCYYDEKEEKKCEYCSVDVYNFKHNFSQDNKNKQIIFFPTSSWEAITKLYINYCPMCR